MTVLIKSPMLNSMTEEDKRVLGADAPAIVRRYLSLWQTIHPTPLIPLNRPGIAGGSNS